MTPRTLLLLSFSGFAVAAIGSSGALAASPAYCALYSREYAVDTVQPTAASGMFQSIQDQAYYRCLNQDEDPPLPQKSAYFGKEATKPGVASAANAATSAAIADTIVTPPTPKPAPAPP